MWATVDNSEGAPLSAATTGLHNVDLMPLEAIKVTATGATVVRITQNA